MNLLSVKLGTEKNEPHRSCQNLRKNEIREMCQSYVHIVFFKEKFETEPYVYKMHEKRKISLISQFRCGILPLKVETGCFSQIPFEFRLCTLCSLDKIEDEFHFFFVSKATPS